MSETIGTDGRPLIGFVVQFYQSHEEFEKFVIYVESENIVFNTEVIEDVEVTGSVSQTITQRSWNHCV